MTFAAGWQSVKAICTGFGAPESFRCNLSALAGPSDFPLMN